MIAAFKNKNTLTTLSPYDDSHLLLEDSSNILIAKTTESERRFSAIFTSTSIMSLLRKVFAVSALRYLVQRSLTMSTGVPHVHCLQLAGKVGNAKRRELRHQTALLAVDAMHCEDAWVWKIKREFVLRVVGHTKICPLARLAKDAPFWPRCEGTFHGAK